MNGTAVKAANHYNEQTGTTLSGKELLQLAATDPKAAVIVDELYDNIANGLYNIQVSLDPEMIVIGGGVSAHHELIQKVEEKLLQKLQKEEIGEIMPKVKACNYRNDANLIGAAVNFENLHC